jgi:UPF0755 protein
MVQELSQGELMRFFASIVTFLFIGILAVAMAVHFVEPKLNGPGPLAEQKNVVITRGSGVSTIGHQLEKEGVIGNHTLFRLRHFMEGKPDLQAGEYQFSPHESLSTVIAKMAKGDVIVRKVTVPEGWTSGAIVELLRQEPALTGDITEIPAEGSLAPETYRFMLGDTRQSLIETMQKKMRGDVEQAWNSREPDSVLQTPEQLVTLAAIVEKETGMPGERPRVAGVYVNRLKKSMLLQSDPTVIYGITHGTQALGRAITMTDLTTPTPYNTYTQNGLPPGPIANPGKASLMAAAAPEKHEYLYFVADGTGGHKFAATLDEHNKNVAAWRKIEKNPMPATVPPAAVPGVTAPSLPDAQPVGNKGPVPSLPIPGAAPAPAAPATTSTTTTTTIKVTPPVAPAH